MSALYNKNEMSNTSTNKLIKLVVISILLLTISGCGIAIKKYSILKVPKDTQIEIKTPRKELRVGEKLTYKVEWMGMRVAIVTLSVKEITKKNKHDVYHIHATINTTPVLSKLYKVEDEASTYMDKNDLYPVRFEKIQREGSYRADEYIDFDQKKGKAYYVSRLNGTKKEFDIPKKVHDVLSVLYYFRLQDIKAQESLFTNIIMDEKNYLLEAKIHKKGFVKIKNVGEWKAFMVEPLPWFHGKVKRKAKATIWFSADEARIPLLIKTSPIPFVGRIIITLQKVEYLDTMN